MNADDLRQLALVCRTGTYQHLGSILDAEAQRLDAAREPESQRPAFEYQITPAPTPAPAQQEDGESDLIKCLLPEVKQADTGLNEKLRALGDIQRLDVTERGWCRDAADALDAKDARIAELEKQAHFARYSERAVGATLDDVEKKLTEQIHDMSNELAQRRADALGAGRREAENMRRATTAESSLRAMSERAEKADALHDSAYIAGAKIGFELGAANNHAKLKELIDARSGYLAALDSTRPAEGSE